MKPIWREGALRVELHKPDVAVLEKAMAIGSALTAMNQETGPPLVEAIAAIIKPPVVKAEKKVTPEEGA